MSTQIYYKDRLGFDPREDIIDNVPRSGHKAKLHEGSPFKEDSPPKRLKDQHGGYEDALTQFKGLSFDLLSGFANARITST